MLGNWIKQTTTSTGTGNLTLAAVSGFPTYANQFSVGEHFHYSILNDADGTPIESGIGHLSDSTTLVRDKVLATFVSGAYDDNDPTAAALGAGTKRVICAAEQGAIRTNLLTSTNKTSIYPTGHIIPASSGTAGMFLDIVVYIPLIINTLRTIDAIVFRVSTAGGPGSVSKVGIYSAGLDGKPKSKIDESASIDTTTTGEKVAALTKRRYKTGLHFIAYTCSVAAPTCNSPSTSGISEALLYGGGVMPSDAAFYEANAALSLPATANVTSGRRTLAQLPIIALRTA